MSILNVLGLNQKNNILCEYTNGNKVNFIKRDEFTFLCLSNNMPDNTVLNFLEEVYNNLSKQYELDFFGNAKEYKLSFDKIKEIVNKNEFRECYENIIYFTIFNNYNKGSNIERHNQDLVNTNKYYESVIEERTKLLFEGMNFQNEFNKVMEKLFVEKTKLEKKFNNLKTLFNESKLNLNNAEIEVQRLNNLINKLTIENNNFKSDFMKLVDPKTFEEFYVNESDQLLQYLKNSLKESLDLKQENYIKESMKKITLKVRESTINNIKKLIKKQD